MGSCVNIGGLITLSKGARYGISAILKYARLKWDGTEDDGMYCIYA